MKRLKVIEGRSCPKCGSLENQTNRGHTVTGSQRCYCKSCNKHYTPHPKPHRYPEELRIIAMREYYSGVSGRGVGKIHNMSKANVYNWIKKK